MHTTVDIQVLLKKYNRIGLIDSGIGGLSVLQPLSESLAADFVYLADTAHLPYGNRSIEELQTIADQAVHFLLQQSVELIIFACHTLSAVTYQQLKKRYPNVVIIGMIDLVAQVAMHATKNNKIGILATAATIKTQAYTKHFEQYYPFITVYNQACPLLAGTIEDTLSSKKQHLQVLIQEYCAALKEAGVDTVILGSTHYSFVEHLIQKEMGPSVTCVSAEKIFRGLDPILPDDVQPSISFFVTGSVADFANKIFNVQGFAVTPRVIQSARYK